MIDLREAVLLVDAGKDGIVAHLGGKPVAGVPPVDTAICVWRQSHMADRFRALSRSRRRQAMYPQRRREPSGVVQATEPMDDCDYAPDY